MKRLINPDEKYERERERWFFGSNRTYTPPPPYRPKLSIPKAEPEFEIPPGYQRCGICGWYADDNDLATTLDAVYGKGNWQAKNYLMIRDQHGVWQDTDYRVKQFVSGKYFIDDETRN